MASVEQPSHLAPSELGTKEYWEQCYTREIENNQADPEDEGTIWFDDTGAEEKMISMLGDLELPSSADQVTDIKDSGDLRILDIGTGNGHMLFSLAEDDWKAQMVGVDYSANSVQLAQRIRQSKLDGDIDAANVTFEQWDMLADDPGPWLGDKFDIVLDKGTFDAISLSDQMIEGHDLKGCEVYPRILPRVLKKGGYFVITSCNWTEEEVQKWFESDFLSFHSKAQYPSFSFGGQKGQSVSTVCFQAMK